MNTNVNNPINWAKWIELNNELKLINMPVKLRESQEEVLTQLGEQDKAVVRSTRQRGLTTILLLDLAKFAILNSNSKIALVNPNNLLNEMAHSQLMQIFQPEDIVKANRSTISLTNGSTILFFNERALNTRVRGLTFNAIYTDTVRTNFDALLYCHFNGQRRVFGFSEDAQNPTTEQFDTSQYRLLQLG